MPDCPFLSSFDNDVECYRELFPFYNYKGTGGRCPFTPFAESKLNTYHDFDTFKFEGEKN